MWYVFFHLKANEQLTSAFAALILVSYQISSHDLAEYKMKHILIK